MTYNDYNWDYDDYSISAWYTIINDHDKWLRTINDSNYDVIISNILTM